MARGDGPMVGSSREHGVEHRQAQLEQRLFKGRVISMGYGSRGAR